MIRKFTDEQENEICKIYFRDRLTLRQTAKRFQCGSSTIESIIHRQGLKPRNYSEAQTEKRGKLHQAWKGGKFIDVEGYVWILKPNHPNADIRGYVREHRLVIEKHIGRYLKPEEVVHHKNGIRNDNKIENLIIFTGHKDHYAWHKLGKTRTKELLDDFKKQQAVPVK